jgi:transaldolase
MTSLKRLYAEHDQSPWIDFIDRELIESGRLGELIGQGIRGLTSNPTIFAKAVKSGQYDELIKQLHDRAASNEEIYEEIAAGDVGDAADLLRDLYDECEGRDGFASIEVEPALAGETDASIERARHLFARLDRPNVFVKIPATAAGLPAITTAISEGININVTLMFSVEVYRKVARAYIEGLRRRHERGKRIDRIASVASFFVSRVDTKVDQRLDERGTPQAQGLHGRAAIANAKLAYQAFLDIFHGPEFKTLAAAGARVQRCLWASTSTKNPAYRDVMYVEELIGPETVDTMPPQTIEAFLDHGNLARRLDADVDDARQLIREVEAQGISMDQVTSELTEEGVEAFADSFGELIASIEEQRKALAPA